jgi:hypothetical protein
MQSNNQMSNTPFQSLHQQCVVVDALIVDASNVNVPEHLIPGLDAIARDQLPAPPREAVVIGSTPGRSNRKAIWQQLGYSAHFVERSPGQGEAFVDDALVAHMQRAILSVLVPLVPHVNPSRHLIVLVTGDGDGRPSFKHAVLVALRAGLNVKLICYHDNPVYLQFALEFPTQLQIVQIDKAMVKRAHALSSVVVAAGPVQPPLQQAPAQPPLQQAPAQSFVEAAHAYLLTRNATSAASAVRLTALGAALLDHVRTKYAKFQKCLQAHPSMFCLLDVDRPGFTSVYITPST